MKAEDPEPSFVAVSTAVLWLGSTAVSILGMRLAYAPAVLPTRDPPPVQAQIVHVELSSDASPALDVHPSENAPDADQPPAPLTAPAVAAEAAMTPLAIPFAANPAFVEPMRSQTSDVIATTAPAVAQPRHLTFGQGEARQPVPEYPREAQLAHQQGSVLVRFTVGEDGKVRSAEVATPCPFAILNQAAARGVRDTWRFAPGPVRNYEVTIEYTLKRR